MKLSSEVMPLNVTSTP